MKKIIYGKNKNIISTNLKIYRMKKNLSQSQLAAKMQTMNVNMDQQMISKIENNARFVTDYELACFCLILEIDLKDMLGHFYNELETYLNKKRGISFTPLFITLFFDIAIILFIQNAFAFWRHRFSFISLFAGSSFWRLSGCRHNYHNNN